MHVGISSTYAHLLECILLILQFEASNDDDESKGLREGDIWMACSGEEEEGGFVMDDMEIVRQVNDGRGRDDNDRDKVNQEEGGRRKGTEVAAQPCPRQIAKGWKHTWSTNRRDACAACKTKRTT